MTSQLEGISPSNSFGFALGTQESLSAGAVAATVQHITLRSMELHAKSRRVEKRYLTPDPKHDAICAIFYVVREDASYANGHPDIEGIILLESSGDPPLPLLRANSNMRVSYTTDESALLDCFVDVVREFDPDIFVGYKVQNASWGYLVER
eukprot:UC1_evm1s1408